MEATLENVGSIKNGGVNPTELLEEHKESDDNEREVNGSATELLDLLRHGVGLPENSLDVVYLTHDECLGSTQSFEHTNGLIVLVLSEEPARSLIGEKHEKLKHCHKACRHQSHQVEGQAVAVELDSKDVRDHHSKGHEELVAVSQGTSLR